MRPTVHARAIIIGSTCELWQVPGPVLGKFMTFNTIDVRQQHMLVAMNIVYRTSSLSQRIAVAAMGKLCRSCTGEGRRVSALSYRVSDETLTYKSTGKLPTSRRVYTRTSGRVILLWRHGSASLCIGLNGKTRWRLHTMY